MVGANMLLNLDKNWDGTNVQDLIVDLVNALSAVRSLSEISCEMADEKAVIRLALSCLLSNQDIEKCSFFILDDSGLLSNVTGVSVGERAESDPVFSQPTMSFRMGEGIIGAAAATGEMQYCSNCREDDQFTLNADVNNMPGSIVCTPVFTLHKELIGVLNVSHSEPEFFSIWHKRLLQVFSNILGQLITNRRLFQQMEIQIATRTAELERLVEETRRLKDYYVSMSMQDQLTGLHNRRYFYDQVELAFAQHNRYEYPFCLLMMDIDHFKHINDEYGHAFGDEVLITVAGALQKLVRNTDILVRFGGEEFVIIFVNTGCDNGKTFAERIRDNIKNLRWQVGGKQVQITISIGLYCMVPESKLAHQYADIDQIIHCADTALYKAKANGRDRVEVFEATQLADEF
ncbi:sensor domain-containing diguanylate cyclase [Methylomonas methanica]|uniref:diguanylate cyclase n=1 Tax=Methylomonas methanica (strain DSM 25384 / MC09) TaxID=857087 RepID=G0A4C2_METMM|nr:sensor domain-containing diguanylate cyclase [Methylomonas methanica]AEG00338.1 diguanylate cyclase [Methylomonas methanica MC09]